MRIRNKHIDGGLFEMYVFAVRNVLRAHTLTADMERQRIHNLLLEAAGTTRSDTEFCHALANEVLVAMGDYYV